MTHNEYKVGDKVMFKGDGTLHVITDINEEGLYKVSGSCGWFGARYLEPYDRRTAFLTRLQSLLREYDASFEFYDVYDMEIRIGEESVEYGFLNKENSPSLTADNIMDFDKE